MKPLPSKFTKHATVPEMPTFEMGAATLMTDSRAVPTNRKADASTPMRRAGILSAAVAVCAVLLGLVATPAISVPSLAVELTRDESILPVVHRDDERVDYTVEVTNTASNAPTVGDAVTCDPRAASWFNSPSFSYQWVRDGASLGSANGAQTTVYTVQAGDAGHSLQCVVVGANAGGAASSFSDPIVVNPQPATAPPSWSVASNPRPTITPTGNTTAERTCNPPTTWSGSPSWTYQWLRNGAPITDATNATYLPGPDDAFKVLQCQVTGQTGTGTPPGGGAAIALSNNTATSAPAGFPGGLPPNNNSNSRPFILIGNDTSGTVTVEVELPAGADIYKFYPTESPAKDPTTSPGGWSCSALQASGSDPAKAVCTRSDSIGPGGSYPPFTVAAGLGAAVPDTAIATATVSGGGASAPLSPLVSFEFAAAQGFGIDFFETFVLDESDVAFTQAGGHPFRVGERFSVTGKRPLRDATGFAEDALVPVESFNSSVTETPRGFVGSARAIEDLCPSVLDLEQGTCSSESVVGQLDLKFGYGDALLRIPVYALEPEFGRAAQFGGWVSFTRSAIVFYPRLRADDGYAVSVESAPAPLGEPRVLDADVSLCGFGARQVPNPSGGFQFDGCKSAGEPDPDGGGPQTAAFARPLVTLPPRCGEVGPTTVFRADSWEHKGVFESASFTDPSLTGCELVQFDPEIDFDPTSTRADSATGLDVELSMPADGLEDPEGVSQAHLRKTVVELPEGVAVNPSAAAGLEGCSDAQLGLGTDSEPACPDGSRIASVEVTTPVLEETLSGVMVLRTPRSIDPMSGEMLRMALVVRNDERGLLVKLPGFATADPQTGRLTATFDENPELPIGTVTVGLKGGERGVLAMPQGCGEKSIGTELSPWKGEANVNAVAKRFSDAFAVGGDCSFGFAPVLDAGMDTQAARANGKFSFKFTRRDGEQWLRGLTARLPRGLLASVKGLPLCSNAQADAGSCPQASRIGTVDAKAGSGNPFVLEQKGEVFLTEGYKGGEYGLAVKIRAIAGPFRGQHELSPIIVRQAIHVDRTTAQVTASSDPFPLIHHGVPLRTREVTVLVDRPGFMLNPSDCSAKQVNADLVSAQATTTGVSNRFQAVNCANLAFKPRLTLRMTGRKQTKTGKHPGVRATVTQKGISEAGIEKAVVRLPKSLALDPDNAQALCEFEDGTRPDLENHCPKGSIVGRARAKTPLLNRDLVGNVYFVKNVRRDPKTGNQIRTLPMIVVALRGEIAINLKGESNTTRAGKLVNTFNNVPDAPVSRFNLNINGGSNGILAVTRTRRSLINLCTGRHIAEADIDGHNGRRADRDVRFKTPCPRATKKSRRAAKRAKGDRR